MYCPVILYIFLVVDVFSFSTLYNPRGSSFRSVPIYCPVMLYIFVLGSTEICSMSVIIYGFVKLKLIVLSGFSVMSVIGLPMNFRLSLLALKSFAEGRLVFVSELLPEVPGYGSPARFVFRAELSAWKMLIRWCVATLFTVF